MEQITELTKQITMKIIYFPIFIYSKISLSILYLIECMLFILINYNPNVNIAFESTLYNWLFYFDYSYSDIKDNIIDKTAKRFVYKNKKMELDFNEDSIICDGEHIFIVFNNIKQTLEFNEEDSS